MFVVRVMPIARGIFKDRLTFFSRDHIQTGSVVQVSIRNRTVPALVVESHDAREEKSEIRNADFALKKISPNTRPKRVFTDAFVTAMRKTALWHGVNESAAVSALTSTAILESASKLEAVPEGVTREHSDMPVRADLLVLQADYTERIRTYRNSVREAFARSSSVILVAPTIKEAETLERELGRGIEGRTLLMTSAISKKKLIESWNRAILEKEPLLIIGNAFVLSVPRTNIDSIIVERESARSYRGFQRPHLDIRRAAEHLARENGARFILADFPLRVETRYRVLAHEMDELTRPQSRSSSTAHIQIRDVRKKDATKGSKRVFSTLSEETKITIADEILKGGQTVVFAVRRGIAPLTVCNDCGTPITDPVTGAPMTLHKSSVGNVFMSYRSGAILPAETACKNCGSWDLVTLGVGVDRVADELKKTFPDQNVLVMTKDTATTHASAEKISAEFYATKGAILVGTERMLPYLKEPIDTTVVASIDSALSLSAWRAHEHALSVLFYLLERTDSQFILETRKPDNEAVLAFATGNPSDFYRNEISERERYDYPPFSVFVGLVWRGTKLAVEKNAEFITTIFKDTDLVGPLPPRAESATMWVGRAVIRVARNDWPQQELIQRLHDLPPGVDVTIDPDEIV